MRGVKGAVHVSISFARGSDTCHASVTSRCYEPQGQTARDASSCPCSHEHVALILLLLPHRHHLVRRVLVTADPPPWDLPIWFEEF